MDALRRGELTMDALRRGELKMNLSKGFMKKISPWTP